MEYQATGFFRASYCFGQAAIVIPMSVTQDHKVSTPDIDVELPGVMQKYFIASAEIVEYANHLAFIPDLHPEGEPLLTPQVRTASGRGVGDVVGRWEKDIHVVVHEQRNIYPFSHFMNLRLQCSSNPWYPLAGDRISKS